MVSYDDYMKSKTIDSQIQKMYGENPFHNAHIDEFRDMAELIIGDRFAVDLHPLVKAVDVGGGIQAGSISGFAQDG